MGRAKTVSPFSLNNIDLGELSEKHGQFLANDDVVLVINGHIQYSPFLEEGKIYQVVEPRLVLAMEGNADICINLQDWHIEKGAMMLLPSDTILEVKEVSPETRIVAVVFNEGIEVSEEAIFTTAPSEFDRILRMVYLTWDFVQLKPYRRRTVQNLLKAMVSDIQYIKDIEEKNEKHNHTTRTQELFIQFKRLIHRHCTHERSIPFYAEQLHVTPHHLSAIIKKASSQSVMYWINRATIQEAKLLLKTNDVMGYEIADRLNFPSASAFSKYFRRETGMTPRMYQENVSK
ncbi:helix-turn-helix domain-containing protein [Prevotella fusca]|uniref:AraC family transcriptional regulator n=1 Tax=Prevotella fusca JCM 17724 TaxID=1236517 RepID=A0A0K1NIA4_9BACT|nr:AraC family transcriptional regulator [Prevotella fusca]AKU68598.1 AraC family transcriptional regulator [Prevotella fusca JCM 17724]QUB87552.1 AraC family transcriptional regulator [Prevotella fusca JCM 17724]